jgi:hypothetical protein
MATTTPNYGWPVPTSTDYVKDGATAIEALGDAIDATVFALPTAGFDFVTGATFTAATSFSLPTNTFSADYTNYKLQVFITGTSAQSTVTMRYRTAGTDNSAATYNQASAGRDSDGNAINITQSNATSFTIGQNFATGGFIINLDIFNPVGATRTLANGFYSIDGQASGGNISSNPTSLLFRNTTSFDSLSVISSVASSLTGSYKVYGYANS